MDMVKSEFTLPTSKDSYAQSILNLHSKAFILSYKGQLRGLEAKNNDAELEWLNDELLSLVDNKTAQESSQAISPHTTVTAKQQAVINAIELQTGAWRGAQEGDGESQQKALGLANDQLLAACGNLAVTQTSQPIKPDRI